MYLVTINISSQEGFENEGSVTYEDSEEIYDDLYAGIYAEFRRGRFEGGP